MSPRYSWTAAIGAVLAAALCTASLVVTPPALADTMSTATCEALDDDIYSAVRPTGGAQLLTPYENEYVDASVHGYEHQGRFFRASTTASTGLVAVHRLYRPASGGNFYYTASDAARRSAVTNFGYVDQGPRFYASTVSAPCLVPLHRLRKAGRDRHALTAQVAALKAGGWTDMGPVFYVAPAEDPAGDPEDPTFSFAAIPDTQQEVFGGTQFIGRNNWLVGQRDKLDLEFVAHTGDLVNWDTPDHAQFEFASKGMVPLEKAGIPYSIAIGNHDTAAVKEGGSAADPTRTRELQRNTTTFNRYFTAQRFRGVTGAFEQGKVDNIYSIYEAGGTEFMVLVLELWPRQEVVEWAKRVVAAHPDTNVIVSTHHYLNGNGTLGQSREYGHTSPQYLYDNLISRYSNIKVVLSGHVGQAGYRVDTGRNGNTIHSFLTTFHSNTTNPVRLFEVDTQRDSLKTWIYGPQTNETWTQYNKTVSVDWVD